jgi:hypothetical protein
MKLSDISGKISVKIATLKLQFKKLFPNIDHLGSLLSSQHREAR